MSFITDELVEKAAKAMEPGWFSAVPIISSDEEAIEQVRNEYRKSARRALEAVGC